jgi:1-deoxy-D-xylulose-5-phosphate reductoisomerase
VSAFIDGQIGFLDIAATVGETLSEVDGSPAGNLEELVAADAEARRIAARRHVTA